MASEAAANDAEGYRIKGNIGSKGDRIYHMPGAEAGHSVICMIQGKR